MSKYADMLPERSHTVPAKRPREFAPVSEKALPLLAPGNILQRAALALESPRPAEVVRMQQTLGNRAVGELLGRSSSLRPRIQAKLTVNAPGDEYEREADRVAEQVMRMPAVQRAELDDEDEALDVMTKREPEHAASDAVEAGEEFERQLNVTRGQGQALPPVLKQEFETKFGADFSPVRLHADIRSAEMNRAIQAKAFTHGQDIYLGAGQHGLDSTAGKRLLAHELTHVVQQNTKNEFQENPRHSSDGQRNGTTTEGSPSEIGHNLKRSDWAHSSLVLNRTTSLIQPKRKREEIPDEEWNEHLLGRVTDDRKKKAEEHYNVSQRSGEKIRAQYEKWKSKTPEQQIKEGSTRTFRSKGYKTDIKPSAEGFEVQTYRKMESLFELDEVESKKVRAALESGNTDEIKKLLKSQKNIDTYGDLEIEKKEVKKKDWVWDEDKSDLVEKDVILPEWQIRDNGETGTKSTDSSYGRTYVARPAKNNNSIVEFYGFRKSPNQQELEQAKLKIPYSSTYILSAGKFRAESNYKEWEEDQTFAEANSEIIWNQYKSAIKAARSANADLKYTGNLWEIERNNIENKQTQDTIFLCDGGGEAVLDPTAKMIVRPDGQDSEDFWALIGTPNGTSAGWLIIDHGKALGLQSLESIEYQQLQMNIKYSKRKD